MVDLGMFFLVFVLGRDQMRLGRLRVVDGDQRQKGIEGWLWISVRFSLGGGQIPVVDDGRRSKA